MSIAPSACKPKQNHTEEKSFGTVLGMVDSRLDEASGLVTSINNPGFLWTLNDSGNPAEIFLLDQQAKIRLVVTLADVENRDWEDLAIDIGPDGKSYLYIADIGDNFLLYDYKIIYRFEEPVITSAQEVSIEAVETFVFEMPDGICDAETILIEPNTHDIFIISKSMSSSGLYKLPNPLQTDTMFTERIMSLAQWEIVGGNISADGNQVLLKSYNAIYYWKKSGEENLQQILSHLPIILPYRPEPQGEAIAWSRSGEEFFTLSESKHKRRASLIMHEMKSQ